MIRAVDYLVGIDIGTTTSKGVLVDGNGRVLASESVTHGVSMPKPGWAEQDPEEVWWGDLKRICRALVDRGRVSPRAIVAIGCSGMMPTVVPLDAEGRPVRPSILYGIDTRAAEEIRIINHLLSLYGKGANEVYRPLTAQSAAPKILWLKRKEPERFRTTKTVVSTTGFLVYRLTGAATIDPPTAMEFAPLLNPSNMAWDPSFCAELGIPEQMLPQVLPVTEVAGRVTREVAAEIGLSTGTPVIVGTGDVLAERIAMGMVKPGDSCLTYGTTMTVSTLLDEFKNDPRLLCGPYVIRGLYRVAGAMNASGALLDWLYRLSGSDKERENWYKQLEAEAAGISPGSEGLMVLPYFSGERTPIFDERARGLIAGLTLRHTRAHLFRAFLEATAYALLHNLEIMSQIGCMPMRVSSCGGGTKNRLWLQIVSDVTGLEQEILDLDHSWGAPLGAAFLAGVGVGMVPDFCEVKTWTGQRMVIRPKVGCAEAYRKYYLSFREFYSTVKDQLHFLAGSADEARNPE